MLPEHSKCKCFRNIFLSYANIKPGTHQADADELVATKADCGVGSRRQQLGLKLPWHTLDTQTASSTSVLRLSRALVCQLNSQSEWSDGPTDWRAPTPIQHVKSAKKKPTRTNFSRQHGTHWENLIDQQTKTARRPTVGLVSRGFKETLHETSWESYKFK